MFSPNRQMLKNQSQSREKVSTAVTGSAQKKKELISSSRSLPFGQSRKRLFSDDTFGSPLACSENGSKDSMDIGSHSEELNSSTHSSVTSPAGSDTSQNYSQLSENYSHGSQYFLTSPASALTPSTAPLPIPRSPIDRSHTPSHTPSRRSPSPPSHGPSPPPSPLVNRFSPHVKRLRYPHPLRMDDDSEREDGDICATLPKVPKLTYTSPEDSLFPSAPQSPPSSPPSRSPTTPPNSPPPPTPRRLSPPECNVNPFSPLRPTPPSRMSHSSSHGSSHGTSHPSSHSTPHGTSHVSSHGSHIPPPSPLKPSLMTGLSGPSGNAPPPSRYTSEFIEEELVGQGSFGNVYKCLNRVDGFRKRNFEEMEKSNDFSKREVYALAALPVHSHVIRYYGAWLEDNLLFIQTEYCGGGSVASQLATGVEFHEEKLKVLLRQIAEGLKHLHAKNLVHLDIKPENIYVAPNGDYKIGDFGLISFGDSRNFEEGDSRYLPRELLTEMDNPSLLLPQADIFSLGISIYELTRGVELPKGGEEWNLLRDGLVKLPPLFSKPFEELLQGMMHPTPSSRPSAAALVSHPLLRTPEELLLSQEREKVQRLESELLFEKIRAGKLEERLSLFERDRHALQEERQRVKQLEELLSLYLSRQSPPL